MLPEGVVVMKRIITLTVVMALALLGIVAAGGSAAASAPKPVTISTLRFDDTWSASGAFDDSGTFVDDPGFYAGRSATFHVFRTFDGANGTFLARGDVRIAETADPDVLAVTGRWAIVRGTGAYEELHGAGTITETFYVEAGVLRGTWQGGVVYG
jgi:hypothetical protein